MYPPPYTAIINYSSPFPHAPLERLTDASSVMTLDIVAVLTRVEAGSNTSTVTLRVVRGDEMGLKNAAP
jgi:hypothetical protein